MAAVDRLPSVSLSGRMASSASVLSSTASVESHGGVDGWANAVEAGGSIAKAPSVKVVEVDPTAAARAQQFSSHIKDVDGFEIEPAEAAPEATHELTAATSAQPAAPKKDELRIEVGGPSATSVVPMLCRLSKVKHPGAPLQQRRVTLRDHCRSDAALRRQAV